MKRFVFLSAVVLLTGACSLTTSTPEEAALEAAQDFANAYFNYDYAKACKYATPESEKWLRFAASNITQADIDFINAQEENASVSVTATDKRNDSTTVVAIEVNYFADRDSIGHVVSMTDEATFLLTVVNRNGKALVRMEGPLRSERQSHD